MKNKLYKVIFLLVLVMAASCDEPETVVTNIIHPDGSVTRKIEMRSTKNNFKSESVQVPFDSTWIVRDSLAIGSKKDTTWFKTAEKTYESTGAINKEYLSEKGVNRRIPRSASFTKQFRWFNTVYRFSEKLDKSLLYGYPPEKFLTKKEMEYFRLPESESAAKLSGPDSTIYKALKDSTEISTDRYLWTSLVSEWIEEFSGLLSGKAGGDFSKEKLKLLEKEIVDTIIYKQPKSDSVWISKFLGESNFRKYRSEVDTASAILERRLDGYISFAGYSVIFIMPGKLTASNGFVLRKGQLMWPVRSDFFLTQTYEMWAESKMPNRWAWIVSGLFLLFVLAGIVFRIKKRG
jgi:hypothetical protein